MAALRTACTYDCPDACGLLVEVQEGKARIRGDPEHPVTAGFVCQRIHRHPRRLIHPDRITRPLLRTDDGFEASDWDTALDRVAARLRQALQKWGPPAVVHVQGGGSMGLRKELAGHFFHSLGPVTTLLGGVCDNCGKEAQRRDFGGLRSHDYADVENAQAVVLWGRNPAVTGVHLVPFLRRVRKRNRPVVLVDVLYTETARHVDRIIRVAPASDGFLALAVLRLLYDRGELDPGAIERTENFADFERMLTGPDMGVEALVHRADCPVGQVEYLADLYARHKPVASWIGWGLQRRRQGGRAIRCIDALCMLSGNVGIEGGGANFSPWRKRGLDTSMLAPPSGRQLSVPRFGAELEALAAPPAGFVWINGANPVCQYADSTRVARALRQVSTVVVADAFFTDTAECADVILPVTLMLEEVEDVVGSFGHHWVSRARKAVDPPEGVREDLWILRELNRRLGRPEDPILEDPSATLKKMTEPWFGDSDEIRRKNPFHEAVPFKDRFDTPTGRMNLVTDPPEGLSGNQDYPLVFMTNKPRRSEHSQLFEDEQARPADCFVHPDAPGCQDLTDDQPARLESPLGGIRVVVHLDRALRKDVCVVRVGGWLRFGRAVNALVAGEPTDMGEGTAFYDQRVRLVPDPGNEPCAP
jgi:anaerobic selenocysteine-containing dehydrogenase